MIQNTNDIYKLISSPLYVAQYTPTDGQKQSSWSYNLFNKNAPHERINIEIHSTHMEIRKYSHMNYEYYENVRTTNQRGQQILQRFKDILFVKQLAAMVMDVEKNYK